MLYFEDLLRMVLEVFSLILAGPRDTAENPHLVYSILHKKSVFEPFFGEPYRSMPVLWEGVSKIQVEVQLGLRLGLGLGRCA